MKHKVTREHLIAAIEAASMDYCNTVPGRDPEDYPLDLETLLPEMIAALMLAADVEKEGAWRMLYRGTRLYSTLKAND